MGNPPAHKYTYTYERRQGRPRRVSAIRRSLVTPYRFRRPCGATFATSNAASLRNVSYVQPTSAAAAAAETYRSGTATTNASRISACAGENAARISASVGEARREVAPLIYRRPPGSRRPFPSSRGIRTGRAAAGPSSCRASREAARPRSRLWGSRRTPRRRGHPGLDPVPRPALGLLTRKETLPFEDRGAREKRFPDR